MVERAIRIEPLSDWVDLYRNAVKVAVTIEPHTSRVVNGAGSFTVYGRSGHVYQVVTDERTVTCNCHAGQHGRRCIHAAKVLQYLYPMTFPQPVKKKFQIR